MMSIPEELVKILLSALFAFLYYLCGSGGFEKYRFIQINLDCNDDTEGKEKVNEILGKGTFNLKPATTGRPQGPSRGADLFSVMKSIPANLMLDNRTSSNECVSSIIQNHQNDEKLPAANADLDAPARVNVENKVTIKPGFRVPGPDERVDEEGIPLSLLPVMDKCSPDGPEAQKMREMFPDVPLCTLVRFLVARKGKVELSSEMLRNHLEWRKKNLPLNPDTSAGVITALGTGVFFPYGVAKDGTPVLVFRGGMYNPKIASPEDYTMAFAWGIEEALRNTRQLQVTVLANCRAAPGGTNAPAEMAFIKKLIGTLSDNFPERLKRTVLFPMPWYARVMKNAVSVFMDPRSMAKIIFSGHDSDDRSPEMLEFISEDQIATVLGGINPKPIPDVAAELKETFRKAKIQQRNSIAARPASAQVY